jgi:hypothetical protein
MGIDKCYYPYHIFVTLFCPPLLGRGEPVSKDQQKTSTFSHALGIFYRSVNQDRIWGQEPFSRILCVMGLPLNSLSPLVLKSVQSESISWYMRPMAGNSSYGF